MLAWTQQSDKESHGSQLLQQELNFQISAIRRNKVSPIEDDFLFQEFYPELNSVKSSIRSSVVVTSDDIASGSDFIRVLCGIEDTFTAEAVLFRSGEGDDVCFGDSCEDSLLSHAEQNERKGIRCLTLKGNNVLDKITFVRFPPGMDSPGINEACSLIFIVLSVSRPDLDQTSRRKLAKLKPWASKIRLIINGNVTDASHLAQLTWAIARTVSLPEMPKAYFIPALQSHCPNRELLFRDILSLPMQATLAQLRAMYREAKLARAHAVLLSYIKSQLPTFNRQAKQDKICADLQSVIAVASSKYGIPVSDFPSAAYIADRLRSFDFTRIKKLKDSNLELVSEFIQVDFPRIKQLLPQGDVAIVEHDEVKIKDNDLWIPPKINEYLADFEGLKPVHGLVSGEVIKAHLSRMTSLSSSQLYKIWELSDMDSDGFLSLKEYAVCRELVKRVSQGHPLPRSLPSSFTSI